MLSRRNLLPTACRRYREREREQRNQNQEDVNELEDTMRRTVRPIDEAAETIGKLVALVGADLTRRLELPPGRRPEVLRAECVRLGETLGRCGNSLLALCSPAAA